MNNELRQCIADQLRSCVSIDRTEVFAHLDEKYRPINLPEDAEVMFAGYVGSDYFPGSVVVLAINPGGGGDSYTQRIPEDEVFYPLLHTFKTSSASEVLDAFEQVNRAFEPIVKQWNLWRILGPTLDAAGVNLKQAAYLNAVPYRTRGDKMPPVHAQRSAWNQIITPSLNVLQPRAIIALGKKAGSVLDRFYEGSAATYVVPRTIGDSYISDAAEEVLQGLRSSGV